MQNRRFSLAFVSAMAKEASSFIEGSANGAHAFASHNSANRCDKEHRDDIWESRKEGLCTGSAN